MIDESKKVIGTRKIGELSGFTRKAIYTRRRRGTMPFATFKGANGEVYANESEVLEYRAKMMRGDYEHVSKNPNPTFGAK